MRNLFKILTSVAVFVLIIATVSAPAIAVDPANIPVDTVFGSAPGDSTLTVKVQEVGATAYDILGTIAVIAAVMLLVLFGVKWMIGTPAKKAELKGQLWSYLVGAILLFGASGIVKTLQAFGGKLFN